jgi:hypothetical protein
MSRKRGTVTIPFVLAVVALCLTRQWSTRILSTQLAVDQSSRCRVLLPLSVVETWDSQCYQFVALDPIGTRSAPHLPREMTR